MSMDTGAHSETHFARITDNGARGNHASFTDLFERKNSKMVRNTRKTVVLEDSLGGCDKVAGVL
jgi:hypothetical protein